VNWFVAPSTRVLFVLGFVPLTVVASARAGVSISAFWNSDGVEPGTRSRRLW
jgi:hypothetical protein